MAIIDTASFVMTAYDGLPKHLTQFQIQETENMKDLTITDPVDFGDFIVVVSSYTVEQLTDSELEFPEYFPFIWKLIMDQFGTVKAGGRPTVGSS